MFMNRMLRYGFGDLCSVVALAIASILLVSEEICGAALFLIDARPCSQMANKKSYPAFIYRYDDSTKHMEEVWRYEPDNSLWMRIWNIDTYSDNGPMIFSEGDWQPVRLGITYPDSVHNPRFIDLAPYGSIQDYKYFKGPRGYDLIQVMYSKESQQPGAASDIQWLRTNGDLFPTDDAAKASLQEVRLCGVRSAYGGGGRNDIIGFRIDANGELAPILFEGSFDWTPVPDSLLVMKSSNGWVMVANEPAYRALMSVPDKNGLTQREVLIYHRFTGIWNSLMIDGAETGLRVTNGWLTGVIADPDPETNYEGHRGFPSILRDDVILIKAEEDHAMTVHLGKGCEILWVEGNTVYYRVGTSLYKARIENDDFIDRELLLNDPRIEYIHWAFRGSEGGK